MFETTVCDKMVSVKRQITKQETYSKTCPQINANGYQKDTKKNSKIYVSTRNASTGKAKKYAYTWNQEVQIVFLEQPNSNEIPQWSQSKLQQLPAPLRKIGFKMGEKLDG
jgi:hypothetical protein